MQPQDRALQLCHAPVDHTATKIKTNWKGSLIHRARSEFKPNASRCSVSCAMFPGNTSTKNSATIQPTRVLCFLKKMRDNPNSISTIPDNTTTRSAFIGTQGGTCAWNSARLQVRCPMPAVKRKRPRMTRAMFWDFVVLIFSGIKRRLLSRS